MKMRCHEVRVRNKGREVRKRLVCGFIEQVQVQVSTKGVEKTLRPGFGRQGRELAAIDSAL